MYLWARIGPKSRVQEKWHTLGRKVRNYRGINQMSRTLNLIAKQCLTFPVCGEWHGAILRFVCTSWSLGVQKCRVPSRTKSQKSHTPSHKCNKLHTVWLILAALVSSFCLSYARKSARRVRDKNYKFVENVCVLPSMLISQFTSHFLSYPTLHS